MKQNNSNKDKIPVKKNQLQQNTYVAGSEINDLLGKDKWKNLFAPIDISSLVFFRILFGFLMLYEVSRYFSKDWIARYWIEPKNHFTYFPFDFLTPLPGEGMYYLFYLMGFLSVCIIIGFFYRISMFLFWLCFSYMFLLEQTRYMNHFYLIAIVSFVMIFIPVNTSVSVDNKIFKNNRSDTAPAWALWLMRFMIAIPYFFGGVAKINSDWLQGEPMKMWLRRNDDYSSFFSMLFQQDFTIYFMSYSGMFLDLLIVPALLFKRTRKLGFVLIATFHLFNSQLFQIGIFPWFMIAASCLYFNPNWLRKIINFFTGDSWQIKENNSTVFSISNALNTKQKIIIASLVFWSGIQIILPLRHFFIPGSVHWTEQGHRYSWHMKLRSKRGMGTFTVIDKSTKVVDTINVSDYINKQQRNKMLARPYLIWQFCQIVKKDYAQKGKDVEIYADIKATLNGRKYQQLIDPKVDLGAVKRPVLPVSWIVPLHTPLSDRLDDNENNDGGGE